MNIKTVSLKLINYFKNKVKNLNIKITIIINMTKT